MTRVNPYCESRTRRLPHRLSLTAAQKELLRHLREEARGLVAMRYSRPTIGATHAGLMWCVASARQAGRLGNARGILKIATQLRGSDTKAGIHRLMMSFSHQ